MLNPPALCFDKNYRYLLDIEDKGPVAKIYKAMSRPDEDIMSTQMWLQQERFWWHLGGVRCYEKIHYEDDRREQNAVF
jgi:hypothetical protein